MNLEVIYLLVGLLMFYAWGHFLVIQFLRNWNDRNGYEKFISITAIVLFILYLFGTLSE